MHRLLWNILFILVFSAGQFLFMLRRADLARRSPLNGVRSVGQFFALNWITLLLRAVVEWLFLWAYRSWSGGQVHWALQHVGLNIPFEIPTHRGLAGAFFLGIVSDSTMDWFLGLGIAKSIPLVNKLIEQIPQLPQVQQLVATLPKTNGG